MATAKEAQAVKSLNSNPGRRNRRFVYKSVAERLQELDIEVFRSLDPVKAEPDSGSFLLDCLLEWRELNTAEDFISFYKEAMPLVQTYPLVLLHKDTLMSMLLSRLQIKARLSLEPILRLIAELSRDLQDDFFKFLPGLVDSLVALLENGADREPDIIEQIFTSWSYIMMYLRKFPSFDIISIMKITLKLRYYPKDYIEEMMAKTMSFLLRSTSIQQLERGIWRIMREAARKPTHVRKFGASSLLYYILRGTESHLHSRAEQMFLLLIKETTFQSVCNFSEGSAVVTELVIDAFERIMELTPEGLKSLQDSLCRELMDCAAKGKLQRLNCLLSVLISSVSFDRGRKFCEYKQLLQRINLLNEFFFTPSGCGASETQSTEVHDKILQLMLCTLDGLHSCGDLQSISSSALLWEPVFTLAKPSMVAFLKELVQKDSCIIFAFRKNFFSAVIHLIETSPVEATYLVLLLIERLEDGAENSNILEGISEEVISRLCEFFHCKISLFIKLLKERTSEDLDETAVALLWAILFCYPHFVCSKVDASDLLDLIDAVDQWLMVEKDEVAGLTKGTFESVIGFALRSYHKLSASNIDDVEHTSKVLSLAKRYHVSSHVLSTVADYLSVSNTKHPELDTPILLDAANLFEGNLCNPNKGIRISTLRLLSHYEPLTCDVLSSKQSVGHYEEPDISNELQAKSQYCNVIELLLSIEETPISITTSKKLKLLVDKIEMIVSTGKLSEVYIFILLHGIIGIFYNHFTDLSKSASKCLSNVLDKYSGLVWDKFVCIFDQCLWNFLKGHGEDGGANDKVLKDPNDLQVHFQLRSSSSSCSSPYRSILAWLLQALQRVPGICEGHSRQIVPLFLRFLGYSDDNPLSVFLFDRQTSKVKSWKTLLLEWLTLIQLMRNAKSLYRSQILKDILILRLLDENDDDVQMKVLDCIMNWKDGFLAPYYENLKNLIYTKSFREELTTWSLSKEANLIDRAHRKELVPFVIRLLMPKVRNLKKLGSRKHASISSRKAILGFVAHLESDELPLFFAMLTKSLLVMEDDDERTSKGFWWSVGNNLEEFKSIDFLELFTEENILSLPWKKRYAFLHVIEDILGVFNQFQISPFLDLLCGFVVRILGSCSAMLSSRGTGDHTSIHDRNDDACKDLRSLCLKVISVALNKYEDHEFDSKFWDKFFSSLEPLIRGFKQEGSSSEKPSALFSCFLVMSRSSNLVSLLCRQMSLVQDIFLILSVPKASEAVQYCVLNFAENLLNLDMELGDENNGARSVLMPNLMSLLDGLHFLFHFNHDRKRKLVKHPAETTIRVLKLLAKFIKSPAEATKLMDILLLLLQSGVKKIDVYLEALSVLQTIVSNLDVGYTAKILSALSPVLVHAGSELRSSICNLLASLAENDSSLFATAVLLKDLNATCEREMDGVDYDTIAKAYERINADYFHSVREDHAVMVLSHCVNDMSSNELILSQNAYRCLRSFVEFSATIIQQEQQVSEETMKVGDDNWTRARIQRIVNKFLLRYMGKAMDSGKDSKKEWIDLLKVMAFKLADLLPNLKGLQALSSEDAEQDFFNNITHLQKHRRGRALMRFEEVAQREKLPVVVLKRVFMPLYFNMLFDIKDGKEEDLRNKCLAALASISSQMQWKSYRALLAKCFRDMVKRPDRQRVNLSLMCSLLDKFHFFEPYSLNDASCPPGNVVVSNVGRVPSVASVEWAGSATVVEIQAYMEKVVLHKLRELRVPELEKVNVNISLAALKVLKLLPADVMDSNLLSVIHHITRLLKHRLESVRDGARAALAASLKELGPEYLQIIVKDMKSLLKQGFERHVLGYSLYHIMNECHKRQPLNGELDYCLNDLLSIVEEDILGNVSEQKDEEKFASKMKETRTRMSFDTLRLIAEGVTFKTHALKVLSPVFTHIQNHLSPKVKAALEDMLRHIADGIKRNKTVDQRDLFVFVFGLIEDGIAVETQKNVSSSSFLPQDGKNTIVAKSLCSHLITEFALRLFRTRLNNVKFDKAESELISMLDPFVKILVACLNSRFEGISSEALLCIGRLITLPLPSLETQADSIKVILVEIVQSSSTASSPTSKSCFKILAKLLQINKVTLSDEQLLVVVKSPPFVDLERNDSTEALKLLKAIVQRKLVDPEGIVYKVGTDVANLMIKSQDEKTRKICSKILLPFLRDYQLSQKRLQQHFDHLIVNLGYEHVSGREAVLEMLGVIIQKLDKSFVDVHSCKLFYPLVERMANETDGKVRELIGTAIQLLISRVSSGRRDDLVQSCLNWYLGEGQQLWSIAAQILGLFVEVMKKGFQKYISCGSSEHSDERSMLSVMKRIMKTALSNVIDSELDLSNEGALHLWKETYYSLVLFQKINLQFPSLFFQKDIEDIWEAVSELLLHPHIWIRSRSNRLVSLYFQQTLLSGKQMGSCYLTRTSRLLKVAVEQCCQLKDPVLDDGATDIIKSNMVFAICGIYSLLGQPECMYCHMFWSTVDPYERECFLGACHLLDP